MTLESGKNYAIRYTYIIEDTAPISSVTTVTVSYANATGIIASSSSVDYAPTISSDNRIVYTSGTDIITTSGTDFRITITLDGTPTSATVRMVVSASMI